MRLEFFSIRNSGSIKIIIGDYSSKKKESLLEEVSLLKITLLPLDSSVGYRVCPLYSKVAGSSPGQGTYKG